MPFSLRVWQCDDQITLGIDLGLCNILVAPPNDGRIAVGSNTVCALELALGAIIAKTNAGIQLLIDDALIRRQVGMPVASLRADEVVRNARQWVYARNGRGGSRALELESYDAWASLASPFALLVCRLLSGIIVAGLDPIRQWG